MRCAGIRLVDVVSAITSLNLDGYVLLRIILRRGILDPNMVNSLVTLDLVCETSHKLTNPIELKVVGRFNTSGTYW
jgi:hypothetical protein